MRANTKSRDVAAAIRTCRECLRIRGSVETQVLLRFRAVPALPNALCRLPNYDCLNWEIPRIGEILDTSPPTSNGGRDGQAYTKFPKKSFVAFREER